MGADGHVLMVREADVPEEFADLLPDADWAVGWERKTLFGSEPFLWTYTDTHGVEPGWWGINRYIDEIEDYRREIERHPMHREQFQERIDQTIRLIEGRHYTLAQAQHASDFALWLEANAIDWQVWT